MRIKIKTISLSLLTSVAAFLTIHAHAQSNINAESAYNERAAKIQSEIIRLAVTQNSGPEAYKKFKRGFASVVKNKTKKEEITLAYYLKTAYGVEIIKNLQDLIKVKTVYGGSKLSESAEFKLLIQKVRSLSEKLGFHFEILNDDSKEPLVLKISKTAGAYYSIMSHADTVTDSGSWHLNPYSGSILLNADVSPTSKEFDLRSVDITNELDAGLFLDYAGLKRSRIYGRGSADDKVGIIISLFAAKALDDAGLVPPHIYVGLVEESAATWDATSKIMRAQSLPNLNIVADAWTVMRAEMGIHPTTLTFSAKADSNGSQQMKSEIVGLTTGNTPFNQVPGVAFGEISKASYTKEGLQAEVSRYLSDLKGLPYFQHHDLPKIGVKEIEGRYQIGVEGKAIHTAFSEEGYNALVTLAVLLSRLDLAENVGTEFVDFVAKHFSDGLVPLANGEGLGLRAETRMFTLSNGKPLPTVANLSTVKLNNGVITASIDLRHPESINTALLEKTFKKLIDEFNEQSVHAIGAYAIAKIGPLNTPLVIDIDAHKGLISNLAILSSEVMDETFPVDPGRGGSYARVFGGTGKIALAVGPHMSEEFAIQELGYHGTNENMPLNRLIEAAQYYALVGMRAQLGTLYKE